MANSYVRYVGDGSTTNFSLTFDYIEQDDISCTVDGVDTDFTWVNSSTIQIATAPSDGAIVELRRTTDAEPEAEYTDGLILTADSLNKNQKQAVFLAAEAKDVKLYADERDTTVLAQAQAYTDGVFEDMTGIASVYINVLKPLAYYMSLYELGPAPALNQAIQDGVPSVYLDRDYIASASLQFTEKVLIDKVRFTLDGAGHRIEKGFGTDPLFHLNSSSRYVAIRNLFVDAKGNTYTGNVITDESIGDGFFSRLHCTDVAPGYYFYEEAGVGSFNRSSMVSIIARVTADPDNNLAVIKMNSSIDPSEAITGNGKIMALNVAAGRMIDCGAAQELKIWGSTGNFPILNKSVKTHFTDCRLTWPGSSAETILIDEGRQSSRTLFTACAFGTKVRIQAPKSQYIGCTFPGVTIDAPDVKLYSGNDISGSQSFLTYTANAVGGRAYRPTGFVTLTNKANVEINALGGDTFTLITNRNTVFDPPTNPSPGQTITLLVTALGSDRTPSFSSSAGGFDLVGETIAAITTNKTDLYSFTYYPSSDKWVLREYLQGLATASESLGPTFASSGQPISATTDELELPLPEVVTEGSMLVAVALAKNNDTITFPEGWTKVTQVNAGTSLTAAWAWKMAGSSESNPTASISTSTVMGGYVFQVTDTHASAPVGATNSNSSSSSTTDRDCSEITTTEDNSRLFYMIAAQTGGNNTDTPSSGWTELVDNNGGAGNPAAHFGLATKFGGTDETASGAVDATSSISATYVMFLFEALASATS